MLKGIALLVNAFGDELRNDVFKDKLGNYSAREIIRLAKERRSGSMGYAEAMLTEYNKKMKHGLSWIKLHSKKEKSITEEEPTLFNQESFVGEQHMVNYVSSDTNDDETEGITPFQQSL